MATMEQLLLATAAGMTMLTTLASAQSTYPIEVPFLQAAIFFMTGKEPPNDVKMESDKKAIVRDSVSMPDRPIIMGTWEMTLRDDKPCILYAKLLSPEEAFNTTDDMTGDGNGGRRLEFNKMPSPRAFSHSSGLISFDLPHETWCSYRSVREDGEIKVVRGSSLCRTGVSVPINEHWYRRIAALDYIRANYCPGQPEPPPRPRMPY